MPASLAECIRRRVGAVIAAWVRRTSVAVFCVGAAITAIVLDDIALVAIGVAVLAVEALVTAAVALGASIVFARRRPATRSVATVICITLAVWAPLPIDWDGSCTGKAIAALWAAPVAQPLYDAAGFSGVIFACPLK